MVTFAQLRDSKPGTWLEAANDWAQLASGAEGSSLDIYEKGTAKLEENWTDEVGAQAGAKLSQLATDFQIAAATIRGIVTTLDGLAESIAPLQTSLLSAVDFATRHDLIVSASGHVSQPPGVNTEEGRERAAQANELIREALRSATEIDEAATDTLRRLAAAADETDLRQALDVTQQAAAQNQIEMLRSSLPIGEDRDTVRAWWDSLTPAQRRAYERAVPVDLYDLDGIPRAVKNRLTGDGDYNPVEAVRWAQENWNNDGIDHYANNCANFVSHALNEGGLSQTIFWDKGWRLPGTNEWFDDTGPWFNSEKQRDMFLAFGGTEVSISQVRPGDVIYFEQSGMSPDTPVGEVHHAALVTAVTPDGDIHYTQHTSDRLDASLNGRISDVEVREGGQNIVIVRPPSSQ
jgi:hypothetical protein